MKIRRINTIKNKAVELALMKGDAFMTAAIQKWGNSQGIRIPKCVLEQINWNTNEIVDIEIQDNMIVLKKKVSEYPIIDLEKKFTEYFGKIPSGEFDWGNPQGEEIW